VAYQGFLPVGFRRGRWPRHSRRALPEYAGSRCQLQKLRLYPVIGLPLRLSVGNHEACAKMCKPPHGSPPNFAIPARSSHRVMTEILNDIDLQRRLVRPAFIKPHPAFHANRMMLARRAARNLQNLTVLMH